MEIISSYEMVLASRPFLVSLKNNNVSDININVKNKVM